MSKHKEEIIKRWVVEQVFCSWSENVADPYDHYMEHEDLEDFETCEAYAIDDVQAIRGVMQNLYDEGERLLDMVEKARENLFFRYREFPTQISKELIVGNELFDFLWNEAFHPAISECGINLDKFKLMIEVDRYDGFDETTQNDPFNDKQKKLIEELDRIVNMAKTIELDILYLSLED